MCIHLVSGPQRDGHRRTETRTEMVKHHRAVSMLTSNKNWGSFLGHTHCIHTR